MKGSVKAPAKSVYCIVSEFDDGSTAITALGSITGGAIMAVSMEPRTGRKLMAAVRDDDNAAAAGAALRQEGVLRLRLVRFEAMEEIEVYETPAAPELPPGHACWRCGYVMEFGAAMSPALARPIMGMVPQAGMPGFCGGCAAALIWTEEGTREPSFVEYAELSAQPFWQEKRRQVEAIVKSRKREA